MNNTKNHPESNILNGTNQNSLTANRDINHGDMQNERDVGAQRDQQTRGSWRRRSKTINLDLDSEQQESTDPMLSYPRYGQYFSDNVTKIDFVLAYKTHDKVNTHQSRINNDRREYYLDCLGNQGVEMEEHKVRKNRADITFVKVHIPFDLLCKTADHLKIRKPLKTLQDKPVLLERYKLDHILTRCFNCYYCTKTGKETAEVNEKTIYFPFAYEDIELFDITDRDTFFTDTQRHECAWEILQKTPNHPGDSRLRGIEGLVERHVFDAAYPCHDPCSDEYVHKVMQKPDTPRQKLDDNWASWRHSLTIQPLHQIRRYFGEKVGFYFAFMDFYTKQLAIPTIAGIIVFIIGMTVAWHDPEIESICSKNDVPGKFVMCPICMPPHCEAWLMYKEGCHKYEWLFALDNEATVALSCFVMFWAIVFLKMWKRREASLASHWNVLHTKIHYGNIRPEYEERAKTTTRINPVSVKPEPYVSFTRRIIYVTTSLLATCLVLLFTGVCLAGLVVSRIYLYKAFRKTKGDLHKHNVEYARWFIHFLIFILVTITEKIYFKIGAKLTSFECPRTHQTYMNSLLWKLFVFGLINEFIPLGYSAWLKGKIVATPIQLTCWTEICDGGCMLELVELVFVLLFFRLMLGNVIEIGVPFVKTCLKRYRTQKALGRYSTYPQFLKDFYLNESELDGVYEEYLEMMVQFMFIVCFIPAFPLAPLICLINNIIEIRLDATKLLKINRRPIPLRVSGIKIWNKFLDLIVKLGVIVNAALIAFTSDVVPRLYYTYNRAYLISPNATNTHAGYTNYSLSYVYVKDWHNEEINKEFEHEFHTDKCYYPGFREPYSASGYKHKADFWRITSIRIMAFAVYAVIFFIIMWLVNMLIPDVSGRTSLKIARQSYLVKDFLNTERRNGATPHQLDQAPRRPTTYNNNNYNNNNNNHNIQQSARSTEPKTFKHLFRHFISTPH